MSVQHHQHMLHYIFLHHKKKISANREIIHSFAGKEFKDFSTTFKYLFQTNPSDALPRDVIVFNVSGII